jgi:hypothetical protein
VWVVVFIDNVGWQETMKSEVEEQAQKCEVKADDSSMSIIGLPGF